MRKQPYYKRQNILQSYSSKLQNLGNYQLADFVFSYNFKICTSYLFLAHMCDSLVKTKHFRAKQSSVSTNHWLSATFVGQVCI